MRTRGEHEGRFAEGIRLFNQRNFFEAHEAWEQMWRIAQDAEKIFYQGLIQAAAALFHVQRGNYAGAVSLYLKSRPRLDQFPAVWMGIELGRLRAELNSYFAALRTTPAGCPGNPQPGEPAQIVSEEQLPTIRWSDNH
jgi:predicted metal-dependent hydrolase